MQSFVDLFKNAIDTMGAGCTILRPCTNKHGHIGDFVIVYMNDMACSVANVPKPCEDKSFLKLTGLEKQSPLFSLFVEVIESRQPKRLLTRLNKAGGGLSEAYYDVACAPCELGLSVTWQKGLQQERKSHYTATELFETWQDSFSVFELVTHENGTEDLRLLAANRTFADLIGQEYETLPGKLFSETCTVAMDWFPFYIKTAKTGVCDTHESYNYGLKKYLSAVNFSPAIGQVALLVMDRTHFYKAETALRAKSDDLSMLFFSMAAGLCVSKLIRDEQGEVVDALFTMVNPAFELLEGFPTATVQGKYLSDIRSDMQRLAVYTSVVESKSKITFTKSIPATGVTLEVLCFSHGDDVFVCVENDVTSRIAAELALKDAQTELAEKHRIIMASIDYASKIQRNLLPQVDVFKHAFADYSVIWRPRDIVGGDIYWLKNFDGGSVLCVCDCTGHGAPGAFLTMLVVSAFETIVTEQNYNDPATIIWQLEQRLVNVLNVHSLEHHYNSAALCDIKDGCDLAVLAIQNDGSVCISAGNTQVFVCDGKNITQFKGQKIFIGEGKLKDRDCLRLTTVPANPNNKFYIASDGFFDQIGHIVRRPFGYRIFKQTILENHSESLDTILQKLWSAFEQHRGSEHRRDDVQLIAFQK